MPLGPRLKHATLATLSSMKLLTSTIIRHNVSHTPHSKFVVIPHVDIQIEYLQWNASVYFSGIGASRYDYITIDVTTNTFFVYKYSSETNIKRVHAHHALLTLSSLNMLSICSLNMAGNFIPFTRSSPTATNTSPTQISPHAWAGPIYHPWRNERES